MKTRENIEKKHANTDRKRHGLQFIGNPANFVGHRVQSPRL